MDTSLLMGVAVRHISSGKMGVVVALHHKLHTPLLVVAYRDEVIATLPDGTKKVDRVRTMLKHEDVFAVEVLGPETAESWLHVERLLNKWWFDVSPHVGTD